MAEVYEGERFYFTFPVHLVIHEDYVINELSKIEAHLALDLLNGEQNANKMALFNRIALVRSFIFGLQNIRKLEYPSLDLAFTIFNRMMELLYAAMDTFPPATGLATADQRPLPIGFFPSLAQKYGFDQIPFLQNRRNSFVILAKLTLSIIDALELRKVITYQQAVDDFFYFYQRDYRLITRSIIHFIYPGAWKLQMPQILKDAVISFVNPPAFRTPHVNDFAINKFVKDCVDTFCDFLKTFLFKDMARRKKLQEVIEKFRPLLSQAEELDMCLGSPNDSKCCYTWVMFYTLNAMNLYVVSGFECKVYSDRDCYYIYWYLDNFIYDWIISFLKTARNCRRVNDRLFPIPLWVNLYQFTEQVFSLSILFASALKCLCGAYFKCLLGFRIEYRLFNPLVDHEEEYFAHYLRPLRRIRYPPGLRYENFKNHRDQCEQRLSLSLYSESVHRFNRALPLLDACAAYGINIGDYYNLIQDNKYKIGQIMNDPHYQRKVRLIGHPHPLFVSFELV